MPKNDAKTKQPRQPQPQCAREGCHHPRSFHGSSGRCKALGCSSCTSFVAPA